MKTFRILGAVCCVFGCIFALLGILTTVLPMIENDQFKMIVESFQTTSADPLTNTLNAIVLFFLHSGYFLFFLGIVLTVGGGLISSFAHKKQKVGGPEEITLSASDHTKKTIGTPKPAYYPGGQAPPAEPIVPDKRDSAPIVSTMKMPTVHIIPDEEESAYVSDESDAQKLFRNDAVLSAQDQFKRPEAPDYSRYPSNSAAEQPADDEERSYHAQGKKPPRIVSTMGKKPL